ncbi:MAG: TlpA disulfide reductase family protein [Chitinophagaceae bacterium]
MRKLLTTFLLIALLPVLASAQQVLQEAGLKYTVTDTHITPDGFETRSFRQYAFAYDPGGYRTWQERRESVYYTSIFRCTDQLPISYISNSEKSYSFEDMSKGPVFDLGKLGSRKAAIRYTGEDTLINGLACKRAVMTVLLDGKAEEAEVWYAPAYRVQRGCFEYFFDELEGLPVNFRFTYYPNAKINGLPPSVTKREYQLDSFFTTGISRAVAIPDEKLYTRVDNEDRMKVMLEVVLNNRKPPAKAKPQTTQIETPDGRTITRTQFNPFTVGDTLPVFAGTGPDGQARGSETTYKDKPMVVNFWFTNCLPCIKEMPMLNTVVSKYKDRNISFVGITYNTNRELQGFFNKSPFAFDQISDAQSLIDLYGVFTYPATVITDRYHVIRHIRIGAFDSEAELTRAIGSVLN